MKRHNLFVDKDLEPTSPGVYRYRPVRIQTVRDDFAHRARLQVIFARARSRALTDPDLSDESRRITGAVLSHCIQEIDQSFHRYGQPFPRLNPAALARAMRGSRTSPSVD